MKSCRVDLDKAAKLFSIDYNNSFSEWVKTLPKNIFLQSSENVSDFPSSVQFLLNQILFTCNLNREDYININVMIIPPPLKYSNASYRLDPPKTGTLDRIISVMGSRERFTFHPTMGNAPPPSKLLFPSNCIHLYNGAGCAFEIEYDDAKSCKRPPRNGYRDGVIEKKDPCKRIILIVDVEPNSSRVEKLMNKVSKLIPRSEEKDNIDYDEIANSLLN